MYKIKVGANSRIAVMYLGRGDHHGGTQDCTLQ